MVDFFRSLAAKLNIFPCPICRCGNGGGENFFCPDCEEKMHRITGPRCRACGGELNTALALCSTCLSEKKRPWSGAVSVYEYCDLTRRMIHRFKFFNHPELARPFGIAASERMRQEKEFKADVVVPIPLHFTRQYSRSFNQAALIAEVVAGELGIAFCNGLIRKKRTVHQSRLKKEARRKNPHGVFAVRYPDLLRGKCVLLIDDVFTTGATLSAATKELLKSGSGPVFVLTVARPPRY
ncbi:MAG: ComF family protein [Victivallales bacterium]|jgi:ComF family protein|nr:ComF family protein [Victivallales bacterium]